MGDWFEPTLHKLTTLVANFRAYLDHGICHTILIWVSRATDLEYSLFVSIQQLQLSWSENSSKMSSISLLNPKAESARSAQALAINISASKGLQDVMKTNLGPKGTMKM